MNAVGDDQFSIKFSYTFEVALLQTMLFFAPKFFLLFAWLLNDSVYPPQSSSLSTFQRKQNVKANQRDIDALVAAAAKGDSERITQLLKKGVDINGKASRNARDSGGRTALMAAAAYGRTEAVNLLLSKGAKVNERHEVGGTALTSAASRGHLAVVKALLKAGADPNVMVGSMHGGIVTALMFAMNPKNSDWPKVVDELVTAGAPLNPQNQFYLSPLRWIIDENDPSMLQVLLKRGLNVNLVDEDGSTPLMYAARYGSPDMVRALIDAGADLNAKNKDGETALTIAEKHSLNNWGQAVVQILKQRGAGN